MCPREKDMSHWFIHSVSSNTNKAHPHSDAVCIHQITHSEEKPFQSSHCNKAYYKIYERKIPVSAEFILMQIELHLSTLTILNNETSVARFS